MRTVRAVFEWALVACLCGCVQPDQAAVEKGVVLAVHSVAQPGESSGVGGAAGLVIGVAAGATLGHGAGQVASALAVGLVGSTAGAVAESAAEPLDGVAYTIRLSDGRVVTLALHHHPADPVFEPGSAVQVETTGHTQRVIAG